MKASYNRACCGKSLTFSHIWARSIKTASSLKTSPTNVFKSKAHILIDNRSLLFHYYVQDHNRMMVFTQALLAVGSRPFPIIKMSYFWSILRDPSLTGKSLLILKVCVNTIPNGFLLDY